MPVNPFTVRTFFSILPYMTMAELEAKLREKYKDFKSSCEMDIYKICVRASDDLEGHRMITFDIQVPSPIENYKYAIIWSAAGRIFEDHDEFESKIEFDDSDYLRRWNWVKYANIDDMLNHIESQRIEFIKKNYIYYQNIITNKILEALQ